MYHVTSRKNVKSILSAGLKARETDIWIFDKLKMAHPYFGAHPLYERIINVAVSIATNQCFLDDYVVFKIDNKGIIGKLRPDNVGEFTAPAQWILRQNLIEPKFLKLIKLKR